MHTDMGNRSPDHLRTSVPAVDDEAMELALAELDSKLSAWSDALLDAHGVAVAPAVEPQPTPLPETPVPQPTRPPAPAKPVQAAPAAAGAPDSVPAGDGETDFLSMAWPGAVSSAEAGVDAEPASPDPVAAAGRQTKTASPAAASSSGAAGAARGGKRKTASPAAASSSGAAGATRGRKRKAAASATASKPVAKPSIEVSSEAPDDALDSGDEATADLEAAQRAAQEETQHEELLAMLDEEVVKRVRIAKRFDPTADLKELIEKTQAKASPDKSDKGTWWRRKGK